VILSYNGRDIGRRSGIGFGEPARHQCDRFCTLSRHRDAGDGENCNSAATSRCSSSRSGAARASS